MKLFGFGRKNKTPACWEFNYIDKPALHKKILLTKRV